MFTGRPSLDRLFLHVSSATRMLCFLTMVIREEILVNIKRPDSTPLNTSRRIIWCPFIPDDNEESGEEGSQTLALLHEDRVRKCCLFKSMFNVVSHLGAKNLRKEGADTVRDVKAPV